MYFEDLTIGDRWELGDAFFSSEEMREFAERYDPEPFHVDEEWSRQGPFGEIIASGLLTLGKGRFLDQRHFARLDANGLVAVSIESLNYLNPVRAGDRVRFHKECIAKRESRSRPERGLVTFRMIGRNQHDQAVIEFTAIQMFSRRPAACG